MEILRRSPALVILMSLTAGLAVYEKSGAIFFIISALIFYVLINFLTYEYNLPSQWKIFLTGLGLVLIFSLRIFFEISAPDNPEENFINEIGTITQLRTWGKNYVAVIETEGHGKLIARFHFAEILEGTRIKFDGSTQKLKTSKNPGEFSEKNYWKARGVNSWVRIKNVEELPEKFSFALMRQKISRFLSIKIPKLTGEYLKAAWLGQHTEKLDKQHRKWGTSHLLAVSGFHVGIAVLIAGMFFKKNFLFLSLIMWLYILLTGAAPSAMRAGLMFQIALTAPLTGRMNNGVNFVSAAGVILLLFRPFLFWDIGWRLSVLAALTITMLPKEKFTFLLIGPAVMMSTFPQVITTFKAVPYAGLIINIFAPFYFAFAFSIASAVVFFNFINFPFLRNLTFSTEGIFILWEKIADSISNFISGTMSYNFFIIFLWTSFLIFLGCKYFDFSFKRSLLIILILSFSACVVFW